MKNLQTLREERWQFQSFAELTGSTRRVENPDEIFLLLHGLGERGKRIFRKLMPYLPKNSLIIAPNGPFLVPRPDKDHMMDFGHSWYFYDKIQKKYFMTQDLAKYWLRDLMAIENPDKRPLTIIGFSQGGYLAPVVGKELPETKLIIGIACEFRTTLIHEAPHFPMVALHGEKDEIVKIQEARSESENLKPLGIEVDFRRVPEAAHEITPEMGGMIKNILEFYGTRSL